MIAGAYDRAIRLILDAIGRNDIDPQTVASYIVVGGKRLHNLSAHELRRLVTIAVQSIDLDTPESRQAVRRLAKRPGEEDPTL